jgi:hypothetical protein
MTSPPAIGLDRTVRSVGWLLVFALVLALAWRVAGWAWYFAAPAANPLIPDLRSLVSTANVARFPWFGVVTPNAVAAPVSDVRIIGLFAGGKRPTALLVIGSQNPIAAIAGETPVPGLKLVSVGDDRVVILRNGVSETIMLKGSTAAVPQKNRRKEGQSE